MTDTRKIFLLGAGGHASVVLDMLHCLGIHLEGIIDKMLNTGAYWQGVPVIGDDDFFFQNIPPEKAILVNGVGANPNCKTRNCLFSLFKNKGYSFLTLRHPSAVVSKQSVLYEGSVVMAGAVIQSGTSIGENTVVNTSASVDHHCRIGNGSFISPGVLLCGNVIVGESVFIGAGAVILPGVEIGSESIIGAGAVVTRSVGEKVLVTGNPAKIRRTIGCIETQ